MSIDIPMSCLKIPLPVVKKHLPTIKDLVFTRVYFVKHFLQIGSTIGRFFRKVNGFSDFIYEDRINPFSTGKIEKLDF